MKLTRSSRSSVLKIRNKIKKELNYEIHTRDLPMNVVVDYLIIDADYLKSLTARRESLMKTISGMRKVSIKKDYIVNNLMNYIISLLDQNLVSHSLHYNLLI